ncbi:MAG: FxsA family protein [Pseudolabrys sp.]
MFVAKYLLFAVLALPVTELIVFILVAYVLGFGWALALMMAISLIGAIVLRHAGTVAGGSHIERAKTMLGPHRVTALQSDGPGLLTLLAGFLLLVPGFITDLIGLLLLIAPLRRWVGEALLRAAQRHADHQPGVVDLAPEDWKQVPDGKLTDQGGPRSS